MKITIFGKLQLSSHFLLKNVVSYLEVLSRGHVGSLDQQSKPTTVEWLMNYPSLNIYNFIVITRSSDRTTQKWRWVADGRPSHVRNGISRDKKNVLFQVRLHEFWINRLCHPGYVIIWSKFFACFLFLSLCLRKKGSYLHRQFSHSTHQVFFCPSTLHTFVVARSDKALTMVPWQGIAVQTLFGLARATVVSKSRM